MLAGDLVLEFGGESFLDGEAERAGLILLVAMLLSSLSIRTSARLMRSPKVRRYRAFQNRIAGAPD